MSTYLISERTSTRQTRSKTGNKQTPKQKTKGSVVDFFWITQLYLFRSFYIKNRYSLFIRNIFVVNRKKNIEKIDIVVFNSEIKID